MNSLEVVPSLLEQGSQEVESHHDVGLEVVVRHLDVADGAGHAGDLLELELDGSLDVIELVLEGSVVVNDKRESLDLGEDWSDNSWHLLEDGVRGEKGLVLLGPFLDELLVLVELFEGVKIGELDIDVVLLNLLLVELIGDKAELHLGSWDGWESDGTDETLVLLHIVVLEGELELDGLGELSVLGVSLTKLLDGGSDGGVSNWPFLIIHPSFGRIPPQGEGAGCEKPWLDLFVLQASCCTHLHRR